MSRRAARISAPLNHGGRECDVSVLYEAGLSKDLFGGWWAAQVV